MDRGRFFVTGKAGVRKVYEVSHLDDGPETFMLGQPTPPDAKKTRKTAASY